MEGLEDTMPLEFDEPQVRPNEDQLAGCLILNGIRHNIYFKENIIGRDPNCNIVLSHKPISAKHAAIIAEDKESHFLCDLGSLNKTKIGKTFLKPQVRYFIRDGEELHFGNIPATYNYACEPPEAIQDLNNMTIPETPEKQDDIISETPVKESNCSELKVLIGELSQRRKIDFAGPQNEEISNPSQENEVSIFDMATQSVDNPQTQQFDEANIFNLETEKFCETNKKSKNESEIFGRETAKFSQTTSNVQKKENDIFGMETENFKSNNAFDMKGSNMYDLETEEVNLNSNQNQALSTSLEDLFASQDVFESQGCPEPKNDLNRSLDKSYVNSEHIEMAVENTHLPNTLPHNQENRVEPQDLISSQTSMQSNDIPPIPSLFDSCGFNDPLIDMQSEPVDGAEKALSTSNRSFEGFDSEQLCGETKIFDLKRIAGGKKSPVLNEQKSDPEGKRASQEEKSVEETSCDAEIPPGAQNQEGTTGNELPSIEQNQNPKPKEDQENSIHQANEANQDSIADIVNSFVKFQENLDAAKHENNESSSVGNEVECSQNKSDTAPVEMNINNPGEENPEIDAEMPKSVVEEQKITEDPEMLIERGSQDPVIEEKISQNPVTSKDLENIAENGHLIVTEDFNSKQINELNHTEGEKPAIVVTSDEEKVPEAQESVAEPAVVTINPENVAEPLEDAIEPQDATEPQDAIEPQEDVMEPKENVTEAAIVANVNQENVSETQLTAEFGSLALGSLKIPPEDNEENAPEISDFSEVQNAIEDQENAVEKLVDDQISAESSHPGNNGSIANVDTLVVIEENAQTDMVGDNLKACLEESWTAETSDLAIKEELPAKPICEDIAEPSPVIDLEIQKPSPSSMSEENVADSNLVSNKKEKIAAAPVDLADLATQIVKHDESPKVELDAQQCEDIAELSTQVINVMQKPRSMSEKNVDDQSSLVSIKKEKITAPAPVDLAELPTQIVTLKVIGKEPCIAELAQKSSPIQVISKEPVQSHLLAIKKETTAASPVDLAELSTQIVSNEDIINPKVPVIIDNRAQSIELENISDLATQVINPCQIVENLTTHSSQESSSKTNPATPVIKSPGFIGFDVFDSGKKSKRKMLRQKLNFKNEDENLAEVATQDVSYNEKVPDKVVIKVNESEDIELATRVNDLASTSKTNDSTIFEGFNNVQDSGKKSKRKLLHEKLDDQRSILDIQTQEMICKRRDSDEYDTQAAIGDHVEEELRCMFGQENFLKKDPPNNTQDVMEQLLTPSMADMCTQAVNLDQITSKKCEIRINTTAGSRVQKEMLDIFGEESSSKKSPCLNNTQIVIDQLLSQDIANMSTQVINLDRMQKEPPKDPGLINIAELFSDPPTSSTPIKVEKEVKRMRTRNQSKKEDIKEETKKSLYNVKKERKTEKKTLKVKIENIKDEKLIKKEKPKVEEKPKKPETSKNKTQNSSPKKVFFDLPKEDEDLPKKPRVFTISDDEDSTFEITKPEKTIGDSVFSKTFSLGIFSRKRQIKVESPNTSSYSVLSMDETLSDTPMRKLSKISEVSEEDLKTPKRTQFKIENSPNTSSYSIVNMDETCKETEKSSPKLENAEPFGKGKRTRTRKVFNDYETEPEKITNKITKHDKKSINKRKGTQNAESEPSSKRKRKLNDEIEVDKKQKTESTSKSLETRSTRRRVQEIIKSEDKRSSRSNKRV